jgi:hypothetical protein
MSTFSRCQNGLFLFNLTTPLQVHGLHSVEWVSANYELVEIRKEIDRGLFKVLSQHLSGEIEENPEYEPSILATH